MKVKCWEKSDVGGGGGEQKQREREATFERKHGTMNVHRGHRERIVPIMG